MTMTSNINEHQEELQAFDPEFRCEHLQAAPYTCNDGCYVPAVGGPWKCNNPSCGGHPWKYTDSCFGSKPWIYPTRELGRWDLMRDLATDALPPGGKWALEIILDGHDIQTMTAEQLCDLSDRYPNAAFVTQQSAVTDFERCAGEVTKFINRNTQHFPEFPSDEQDSDQDLDQDSDQDFDEDSTPDSDEDTLPDETQSDDHKRRSSPKQGE